MKQLIVIVFFIVAGATSALGADYSCRWGAESTRATGNNAVYATPPLMIASSACGPTGKATRGTAATQRPQPPKPSCVGYAYCESSSPLEPPQFTHLVCEAVQRNGTWKCPSASACAADPNVVTTAAAQIPAPRPSSGTTTPGGAKPAANGQAIDGVGGR